MAEYILKKRIMRRVYAVWFLKKLTSPIFMKFLILVGALRLSVSLVSVPNVVHNWPALWNIPANYHFFVSALQNTDNGVRLISGLILGLAFWIIYDIIKRSSILTFLRHT